LVKKKGKKNPPPTTIIIDCLNPRLERGEGEQRGGGWSKGRKFRRGRRLQESRYALPAEKAIKARRLNPLKGRPGEAFEGGPKRAGSPQGTSGLKEPRSLLETTLDINNLSPSFGKVKGLVGRNAEEVIQRGTRRGGAWIWGNLARIWKPIRCMGRSSQADRLNIRASEKRREQEGIRIAERVTRRSTDKNRHERSAENVNS